jgi:hypothetical protein
LLLSTSFWVFLALCFYLWTLPWKVSSTDDSLLDELHGRPMLLVGIGLLRIYRVLEILEILSSLSEFFAQDLCVGLPLYVAQDTTRPRLLSNSMPPPLVSGGRHLVRV